MSSALLNDLFIAFRNVTRQKRRSAVGIAAVAFGVIALMEASGFIFWAIDSLREGTIYSELGHLQIVRPGYYDSGLADPFNYLLSDQSPALELIKNTPGVVVVTPRLNFTGLISLGETTISFIGQGIDPKNETELSKDVDIVDGQSLSDDDPNGVILGQGLAANIGVKVGDSITLLANTASGGINGIDAKVRGIFQTATKAYDDSALRVPLPLAQQLLRTTGGGHVWVVLLKNTDDTPAIAAKLGPQIKAQKLELLPWYELADFYNKTVTLLNQQVLVMKVIIGIIIILCISNTLTMSVMERMGEIGTSMALGLSRRNILQQFVGEGFVIGVLGCLIGTIVGLIIAQAVSFVGIPMPPPPGTTYALIAQITITPRIVFDAVSLAIITTLLAAIYPAFKGARLQIVDALRFNR